MYNTRMPHINVMKEFQWDEIKLCAIFAGFFLKLGEQKLQGWVCGVAWGQKDVLVPVYFYYWYGGAIILCIYKIGHTCFMINTTWKYKTKIYNTLKIGSDINMCF